MKIEPVNPSKAKAPDAVIIQMEPLCLNIEQACAALGNICPDVLRKWIRKAGFPATRIGGRVIFYVEEMRAWLRENSGKTIEL